MSWPFGRKKDTPPPWAPWVAPRWEIHNARAMKALAAGTATPEQQRAALDYIVKDLCRTYDLSFSPTSDRETSMAEGRRFVGLQIVKLLSVDISKIKDTENV